MAYSISTQDAPLKLDFFSDRDLTLPMSSYKYLPRSLDTLQKTEALLIKLGL